MEEEDPAAVGVFRADFPATERGSIRCANVEILAGCPGDGEGSVGLTDQTGSQVAANGMEERRAGKPSGHSRQERRGQQQKKSDADPDGGPGGWGVPQSKRK